MPFRKCFYGKVLAVWGVGGEVDDCGLALLEYCGMPVFQFSVENHDNSTSGKR